MFQLPSQTALHGFYSASAGLAVWAGALSSPAVQAQTGFTSPDLVDAAVAQFTGHEAGAVGGARNTLDARLRLHHCAQPLAASWHGRPGYTVKVACSGPKAWHIFVAVRQAPRAAPVAPVVKRGDQLTLAVEGKGFVIRRPAEAQEAGRIGEWIALRTARGAKPIAARLVRPGLAVISLSQAHEENLQARP